MLKGEKEHATVIGASMAGMLAARVLADWFELMTVVERAVLPDSPQDGQSVFREVEISLRPSVSGCAPE